MDRSPAPATFVGAELAARESVRTERSLRLLKRPKYSGVTATLETGTRSPCPDLLLPMRTSISAVGHEAGDAKTGLVGLAQWPALSTCVESIRVPVHPKAPKLISA